MCSFSHCQYRCVTLSVSQSRDSSLKYRPVYLFSSRLLSLEGHRNSCISFAVFEKLLPSDVDVQSTGEREITATDTNILTGDRANNVVNSRYSSDCANWQQAKVATLTNIAPHISRLLCDLTRQLPLYSPYPDNR